MLLYRITKLKYARDLSGEGARRSGGRWNLKGDAAVYTSDSSALAALETLVHIRIDLLPDDLALTSIELDHDVQIDSAKEIRLPRDWHFYPAPAKLAEIGSQWLKKCSSVALGVPSSIIPQGEGRNYLLNPKHPDFKKLKILKITDFTFNKRLLKKI